MNVRMRRASVEASWTKRRSGRFALSGAGAIATGALVIAARSHGLLVGATAFVFVAALTLLLPVGRTVSERIFLVGTSALGWNCVLWWAPLPLDRITIVLALVSSACAGMWLWHLTSANKPRLALLLRASMVDLVPFIAGTAALIIAAPLYLHRDARDLLANLLPGWDNAAHFSMFSSIWQGGATVDALPALPGDSYVYAGYPQAFHATIASIASLGWANAGSDASSVLLLYGRACAAVIAIGATVLVAGLTSLPKVRHRPSVALPLCALLACAFLLGPGLMLHLNGFTAFWLPCVLASCVPFIAVRWESAQQTGHAVAMFGALLGIAHGWLPMLTLAGPMLIAITPRLVRKWQIRSGWRWLALTVVAVAALVGLARAVALVSHVQVSALAIPGAIPQTTLEFNLLLIAATAAALNGRLGRYSNRTTSLLARSNRRSMQVALAAGFLSAIAIGVVQYRQGVFPSYYFWKYLAGFQLFMATLLVTSIGGRDFIAEGSQAKARIGEALLCIPLVTAAIAFPTIPSGTPLEQYTAHFGAVRHKAHVANDLLRAATAERTCPTSAFLVADTAINVANGQGWFLALGNAWTAKGNSFPFGSVPDDIDDEDRVDLATKWLQDGDRCLLVAPRSWQRLSTELPTMQKARLLTW